MYTDEQLQEIRSISKKCLMNLGPLELAEPSDLYPLVAISSDETKITRFTKSVVLISQELTVLTEPALMPTIHLYGPENLGNYEIIRCHPSIRPISGTGIDKLKEQKEQEIKLHIRSDNETLARVMDSYKAYIPYLKDIFAITHKLSTENIIDLCYDSALRREKAKGSHNILDANEAVSDIVLTSICRNAIRSMRYRNYSEDRYIPHSGVKYLSNVIINDCDSIECLKDGCVNNITTFLAVYTLNAMGFPCTLEHLCLALSTRYQHSLEGYNKYIESQYKNKAEYIDLRNRKPEIPHIKEALKKEAIVQEKKSKAYPVVEKSIQSLKKDKLIEKRGKRILPVADALKISTANGFQDIPMPTMETIIQRERKIRSFDAYLRRKRDEWRNH
jgi:hypothetical protein